MHLLQVFSWTEIRLQLIHLQMNTRKLKLEEGIRKNFLVNQKILRPLTDELKMRYAPSCDFLVLQQPVFAWNKNSSVFPVYWKKLLLAKALCCIPQNNSPPGLRVGLAASIYQGIWAAIMRCVLPLFAEVSLWHPPKLREPGGKWPTWMGCQPCQQLWSGTKTNKQKNNT